MVSTHSPDLLNACRLDQIYTLCKRHGATELRRASDDPQLLALVAEGDLPGALWKQGAFEGLNP